MKKEKRKNKYSYSDRIFVITVVLIMCLAIITVPFLVFYFGMYFISLTPDVQIHSDGIFSSIKVILKFFIITFIITGIVDIYFSIVLIRKKGAAGFLSEALLMLSFFYAYVLIYAVKSNDLIMTNLGCFYVALFLFIIYLIIHPLRISIKIVKK